MFGYPYRGTPLTQPYGSGGYDAPPSRYSISYDTGSRPAVGEKPSKPHKGGNYHTSAPPAFAPYVGSNDPYTAASSQYVCAKPSKTGYQPSAPPAAVPYGGYVGPYSVGSEKPSKAQQGDGYGDSYSEKPSQPQQSTVNPYGSPYNKPSKMQHDGWRVPRGSATTGCGYQGVLPPQGGLTKRYRRRVHTVALCMGQTRLRRWCRPHFHQGWI